MIVDVHSHCLQPEHMSEANHRANERAGYPPMPPLSPETYLKAMEVVDKAIVFGVRGVSAGMHSPNDFTADWVKHAPDKLIGFAAVDPTEEDHLEEVDRCVSDLGTARYQTLPHARAIRSHGSHRRLSLIRKGAADGIANLVAHGNTSGPSGRCSNTVCRY